MLLRHLTWHLIRGTRKGAPVSFESSRFLTCESGWCALTALQQRKLGPQGECQVPSGACIIPVRFAAREPRQGGTCGFFSGAFALLSSIRPSVASLPNNLPPCASRVCRARRRAATRPTNVRRTHPTLERACLAARCFDCSARSATHCWSLPPRSSSSSALGIGRGCCLASWPPFDFFFFFFVPEATSLFPRPDMGRRKGQQERFGSGRASRAGRDQETACATHRGPFTLGPGTNVVEPRLAARADWTICLARPVARARIGHCLVRCMHRGPDTRTKTRSLVPASRTWTRPRRDGLPAATSRFQSAFI